MNRFIALLVLPFCLVAEDTIFYGGDILTIDDRQPIVEAVVVKEGKIVFAGSRDRAFQFETSQKVDLQGATLMPGFVDAHTHVILGEMVRLSLDVNPFDHPTIDDVLQVLKNAAQKGPVIAFGYDPSLMTKPGILDFQTLDSVSKKMPILVVNKSGHLAYGNRLAFANAGVTDASPNPIGGSWGRNQKQKINGIAYEVPAIAQLVMAFPGMKQLNFDRIARRAAFWYAQVGYTTVTDLGLGLIGQGKDIDSLRQIAHAPDAPLRVQGYCVYPLLDQVPALRKQNDDKFQILGVKIWSDGSLQGYTAALTQKYDNVDSTGVLNYTPEQLDAMVLKAHQKNLQVAVHANGDRAIADTLDAFAAALKASPRPDPRFRVEHCTIASQNALEKMVQVHATPSFTVVHIYYWGEVFKDKILGEHRADEIDPARMAEQLGLKFSFNDDILGVINPLQLIQIAVTRQMRQGGVLNPAETITVAEGIKAMTIYPAWQSFRDKEIGSIEVGKWADFVLLDQNPLKVDPDKLSDIKILGTWIAGRKVKGS